MMFDDFMSTGMQSLDYDRVVRCAVTIQVDPDVCKVLNASPTTLEECWMPDDACEQQASRSKRLTSSIGLRYAPSIPAEGKPIAISRGVM